MAVTEQQSRTLKPNWRSNANEYFPKTNYYKLFMNQSLFIKLNYAITIQTNYFRKDKHLCCEMCHCFVISTNTYLANKDIII